MTEPAPPSPPLVTVEQLRTYAALPELDEVQTAATQAHLDALVAGLERALNRSLVVREFRETVTTEADGRVLLGQTPVVEILEVSGYPFGGTLPHRFSPGVQVVVRYRAGYDMTSDLHIRSVVMDKALPFIRALLAQSATAGGASGGGSGLVVPTPPAGIKSFVVEGLNVTYESASERQSAALKAAAEMAAATAWTPAELDGLALSRLRKRVVA